MMILILKGRGAEKLLRYPVFQKEKI